MDRPSPSVVALLCLLVVASEGHGNNSTQNSENAIVAATTQQNADGDSGALSCHRSTLCCRLGRKAVRLSYPAMYTCQIKALSQGLEFHTSASHRLKLKPSSNGQVNRMDAANTLHMSFGFRKRLMLCESKGSAQKQCFQDCCERKLREEQARARKTASRQDP